MKKSELLQRIKELEARVKYLEYKLSKTTSGDLWPKTDPSYMTKNRFNYNSKV